MKTYTLPVEENCFIMCTSLTDIYYIEHADRYFEKTSGLDSAAFLSFFVNCLKKRDTVIDIGCGSGRDLLLFKNMGFKPIGFEKSSKLAQLARQYSGCPVIEGDFLSYDFSLFTVQGICFSASLVHTPPDLVKIAIAKAAAAIENNGYMYVSVKEGRGSVVDNDLRRFYLWEDHDLRKVFADLTLKIVDFNRTKSVRGISDIWLSYTLFVNKNVL